MEWLDEQDPELLHATLALVEDWCTTADKLPVPPSSTSSGSGSEESTRDEEEVLAIERRKTERRFINVSRERRKQELVQLKQVVENLQDQLKALQLRRDKQLELHYDSSSGCIVSTAPVWEKIARRQYEARKKAETLNAELRRKLDVQVHVAQGLLRLMQRAEEERKSAGFTTRLPRLQLPLDISLQMSDDDQLRRVEWLCAHIHEAFSINDQFYNSSIAFYESRVLAIDSSGVLLETCTCSPIPFSVARIAAALWSMWCEEESGEDDDEFHQDTIRATNNLIQGVFSAATHVNGMNGRFTGKFAATQFMLSPTQSALVLHSFSESGGFHNDINGVTLSEDAWLRLVDARELGHIHLQGPLTLLQHVRRSRIDVSRRHEHAEPQFVENLIKFFEAEIRDEIKWSQQGLENCLMQPKLHRPQQAVPMLLTTNY